MSVEGLLVVLDTLEVMSERHPNLDMRAQEKHLQREEDRRALESGEVSKKALREQNSYFAVDANVDFSQSDF